MICIADAFDAMTSERTYKERLSVMEAIDEIRMCAGIQFDPDITENFIEVVLVLSANSTSR
jgi:HD-GYP domain-containing protein (c-di-GMP phosphodiesterase class II)